jgi:N-acetylglutamate synthase-like GNAT family acetyltransferase
MVAVKEKYQGTSIGSYMIANCLNELRSNTKRSSHIVGLTTQLPQNETFYTRLGFKTIEEGNVQFKQECYYNYNMKLIL